MRIAFPLSNQLAFVFLSWAAGLAGCSTSPSHHVEADKASVLAEVNLREYDFVTVVPFQVVPGGKVGAAFGAEFADEVYERLKNKFGKLFSDVRQSPQGGKDDQ